MGNHKEIGMDSKPPQLHGDQEPSKNVRKHFQQLFMFLMIAAVFLFASAGTLVWVWAWAYVAIYILFNAVMLNILPKELLAERGQSHTGVKNWDRILMGIGIPFGFTVFLIAGLDVRYHWSPAWGIYLHLTGLMLFILGNALIGWSMASNKFFSMGVRIQHEREHAVASGGPYKFVRHPGYAGIIINAVSTPLLLGSLWAFIPALLSACLFAVRTGLEDRTLRQELEGYKQYSEQVRYRLLPGIW